MLSYKNDEAFEFPGENQKEMFLNLENSDNVNSCILCPSLLSNSFITMMKSGTSPLIEIQSKFGINIPLFDVAFFHSLDRFIVDNNKEGMMLLEFLLCKNINNVQNFYGKYSLPVILNNLPNSFQILAVLLDNSISSIAKQFFYDFDWISLFLPFKDDQKNHLILSIILKSIDPLKIKQEANVKNNYFLFCNDILNSSIKKAAINILNGFQNNYYPHFPIEISSILIQNLDHFIISDELIDEDDIFMRDYLFKTLSKICINDTIDIILSKPDLLFSFMMNSLKSNNEIISTAASELVLALSPFDQSFSFLTSTATLGQILKMASDSLFSIRNNMVLTLCELIKFNSTDFNLYLLHNNVLELLLDFLNADQNQNASEILDAILIFKLSVDETDEIENVVDFLIENQDVFIDLTKSTYVNISNSSLLILKELKYFMIQ